jgi:hypothetical protein
LGQGREVIVLVMPYRRRRFFKGGLVKVNYLLIKAWYSEQDVSDLRDVFHFAVFVVRASRDY